MEAFSLAVERTFCKFSWRTDASIKMSIRMLASNSEETGQNPILAKSKSSGKITASVASSGSVKAAEIPVPGIKKGQFEKAKRETKSPSAERTESGGSKLCEQDAIDAAEPTQGLSQIGLTQTMEGIVEKEELQAEIAKQAALDKKRHEETIEGGANGGAKLDADGGAYHDHAAELDAINNTLKKEKQIRREIEDSLDEIRKEQGGQREDLGRATHVIGKLAAASLQQAEKTDGVTIFVIKKKQQNTREYFEAYIVQLL